MADSTALTPEEIKYLEILRDPVEWAKVFLNWEARWYQEKIIRDKHNRIVVRAGRRIGKCLPGWVTVLDPFTGARVSVEELHRRGQANVVTMTKEHELTSTTTQTIFDNGIKEVFRVTLSSGRIIDATGNHPLYTVDGWCEIDDLHPGMFVATPKVLPYFGDEVIGPAKLEYLANITIESVPDIVFRLPQEQIKQYLARLLQGDDTYTCRSEQLARDIQHLLLRLGINSNLKYTEQLYNVVICENSYQQQQINWERIISITPMGKHQTYDLTVDGTHNFVANDIIVHNTDSVAVKILHAAYTKPGKRPDERYEILMIAPRDSQVRAFFRRIRELIDQSPELKASIKRSKENPHEIEFYNKALIKGFTAGTQNGTGAEVVRGQSADFIFMDEADYLSDKDIHNITAIALEDPERIPIIATSTPTGRRASFFRWCTDTTGTWKQYHYPSSVNPTWTPEVEKEYKETLSEIAYLHEILAEFGEEQAGVFAKKYVDAAIEAGKELSLTYHDSNFPKRGPRILGVDWDKFQDTPNMVGIEWVAEYGKYIPIVRKEVPRTEFTLDAGVQQVIDLDSIFNFDYIYVDRGYGDYQVETLRKYGLTHPETGLHKKVIGIHGTDRINVPDPVTKQKESKEAKQLMINNAVIAFERGHMALVPDDRKMIKQFEEYHVKSIGSAGRPIYSDDNDHILDATCLALLGMMLNFSDMIKVQLATGIAGMPAMRVNKDIFSRDMTPKPKKVKGFAPVIMDKRESNTRRRGFGRLPTRAKF